MHVQVVFAKMFFYLSSFFFLASVTHHTLISEAIFYVICLANILQKWL